MISSYSPTHWKSIGFMSDESWNIFANTTCTPNPKSACSTRRRLSSWALWLVTPTGISMDATKTDAVSVWPTLTNLKAVQAFLGFTNFYLQFIEGFSDIVIPLILLTQKDTPFIWGPDHTKVFETLKMAFTQAPILAHFNPDNPIVVETDASDYAITAIISQISPDDGDIHPVAFYSCSMHPAELNYEIYDKELLAIFKAFRQWHNYLEGSAHVVLVLSNHKNHKYFATTKQLTRRQVRWSEYLSGFNYLIRYRAGRLGTKPDALTHREDVYPRGENAYALANPHNFQSMFKAGQLLRAIILDSASLLVSIRHGLQTDPTHDPTLHAFESALTQPPPSQLRLPQTPGLFHKMVTSFATRDCSISPTIRRSDWTSFALTTTIVWLD